MFSVTGAGGFVGRNVILAINEMQLPPPIAVDIPPKMNKLANLEGLIIKDYMGKDEFLSRLGRDAGFAKKITGVFHEGACTSTIEKNEKYLDEMNFDYTRSLMQLCAEKHILMQYASTAGVYGANQSSQEIPGNEAPLTPYANSKLKCDQFVRAAVAQAVGKLLMPVVGLRYFNVYGPGEGHKGFMRSTPLVFYQQLLETGKIKIFGEHGGYAAGEHRRDFIYIDDLIKVKLWCLKNCGTSGIYNVGTGVSRTFNEIAQVVLDYHGSGEIEYIPFPKELKQTYQCHTQANLDALRTIGYTGEFMPIEAGIKLYLNEINRPADSYVLH